MTLLRVQADLCLQVDVDDRTVRAHLTGDGRELDLTVDSPQLFAGRQDAEAIRGLADALAHEGFQVHVRDLDGNPLLTLGDVRTRWWHRRVTRSRHMRPGGLRGGLTAARGRARRRTPLLPAAGVAPPGTLWPLFPTFQRRPRRRPSTTHQSGGSPRLTVAVAAAVPGAPRGPRAGARHWLTETSTWIGSDPSCDIVLPGLAPRHAEVLHTEEDEYVIHALAPVRVHGRPVTLQMLRTSARLELDGWVLVYGRDEHADHGRPYGGRIGGELGHQKPQPPRARQSADDLTAVADGERP